MPERFEKIARDALAGLVKAAAELDEADRLLTCHYMGTERWAKEVEDWRQRKDAIVDCGRLEG